MPQIPAGWKETTLGEVVEFIDWDRGKNYPNWDDFKTTWFCVFLNAKNLPNRIFDFSETMFISEEKDLILRKGKLKRWDYVMTTRWTIGNFAYYNDQVVYSNMRINSWMVIIRAYKDLINEKFLWLFFSSNIFKYYLSWFTSWSAVPQLPIKDIKQLPIHLPHLPEQQAIAAVLSSFDDKIELLRAENQTLEQMGQELFKERFGKWKVGDELPEGWRVGKLGEVIKFIKGKKPKAVSDSYKEGRIPQVLIETLDGWISLFADPEKSILLNSGEIVMVMDGASSGRCEIGFSWVLWSTLAKIEVNPSLKLMLYALLKNKFKEINGWTTGSSIPHTDKHKICDFDFIIPTKETLYDFNKLYWNLIEKILLNRKQIQTLSATRDQLLPKLMSGEVRVEF